MRLGLAAGLVVCILIGVVRPAPATAHAILLRTIPPGFQTLSEAPQQVRLLFSEPIDPVFSTVRVLGAGQPVDGGDAHVDQTDDHQLVVSLAAGLPNGVYTVSWRSLSTIDVHPDQGQYALYVGVPVPPQAQATTRNISLQFTATPETTLGRWWFYLAASLFGGVLAAWKLVLSGVLVGEFADLRPSVRRRAFRLIVLGGALLVLGTLYTAVAQAAAAAGVPFSQAIWQPLSDLLLRGRFATIWWPRIGLEIASLLLIALGGIEGLAAECALATLPAVLLTSSLTSHGAALPGGAAQGIAIDWLHIVGATAWVGGLVSVVTLFGLPGVLGASHSDGLIPRLVGRFSRLALAAAAIVVLSGVVQAAIEVGSWRALVETVYGQLVLVKVALVAAMLALATVNDWQARRVRSVVGGRVQILRRGVQAEFALSILALAAAATLTGTPPTRGTLT